MSAWRFKLTHGGIDLKKMTRMAMVQVPMYSILFMIWMKG